MMNNYRYIVFLFSLLSVQVVMSQAVTKSDIEHIYQKYVQPNYTQEYKNRYVPLPKHKNNLPWRWEGKSFPRVIAMLEFERFVIKNNITCNKGLAINGKDPEWYYLPAEKIVTISYEENPERYDLHMLDLEQKDFDFVMVNQTLEHVYDPIRCLANIYKHMKKGGILYFNVPSNNIPHSTPFHYYTGFTPVGAGVITKAAGFNILSIGQWGNIEYLEKIFKTQSWPDYRQLKNPGLNMMNCPIITWVFAIKK